MTEDYGLSEEFFPAAIKNSGVAHIQHNYSDQVAYNNVILKLLEKVWAEGEDAGWSRAMRRMSDEPGITHADNPYSRPGFEDAT